MFVINRNVWCHLMVVVEEGITSLLWRWLAILHCTCGIRERHSLTRLSMWGMVSVSALSLGGRQLESWRSHSKDLSNGTGYFLDWHSVLIKKDRAWTNNHMLATIAQALICTMAKLLQCWSSLEGNSFYYCYYSASALLTPTRGRGYYTPMRSVCFIRAPPWNSLPHSFPGIHAH